MALLLVDDRDGRIVSEVETEEDAERVLEAWATEDGTIPDHLWPRRAPLAPRRVSRHRYVRQDPPAARRPLLASELWVSVVREATVTGLAFARLRLRMSLTRLTEPRLQLV